ncbi:MAG TPA: glycosyltransferase family 4 protein [Gemmatimonadaceae bacterium]|nr:glycosyltransferase family 4 protein [Gemmatimonadaceae bacterium]
MRVLMLSYEFPPIGGGGAGVVRGLSAHLARTSHTVDVVTMHRRGLPHREQVDGVQVHRVPCVRLRDSSCTMAEQATYVATALPYALGLVRERRYDVNHTHFIVPDGLLSLLLHRLTGLPYVITCHGSDVPGYNPHRFVRAHRVLAPLWREVVQGAEGIISPSESLKTLVLRAKPDARVTVIPNGIAGDRLRPCGDKQPRILVVTRMVERKGVQFFLRALAGLELEHDVHIVGDGPYLDTLRAMARELRLDVHFWGWLDRESEELARLYETSQIYVFPSEAENFPLVLLEAMSAGAAIITTLGTGCAEVVGDAALLVRPRDTQAIRDAVVRLASDPELCRQLGKAAQARLQENFTWSAIVRRHLRYYQERCGLADSGSPLPA